MATAKCVTRAMKVKGAFAKSALSHVGTVRLVQVTFKTSLNTSLLPSVLDGDVYVSTDDMQTTLEYLGLAFPRIADYCSQYGVDTPNKDVPNEIIAYPMDLRSNPGGNTFNDAQLQQLVNQIIQEKMLTADDALIILSPQGVENTDAPVSLGVLGYHGAALSPYAFVNVLGTGFTIDDAKDLYALALSHEIAEMIVDPAADGSKPEVCDPCAGNCAVDYRNYFDSTGKWIGGAPLAPGHGQYAFFIDGIATPSSVSSCPAPQGSCTYDPAFPPPTPTPGPSPTNCIDLIKQGIAELEAGNELQGLELLVAGLECYVTGGGGQQTVRQKAVDVFRQVETRINNLTDRLKKVAEKL